MDPLDEEKPWGPFGQMVLIVLAIGLIYVVIRLAVVAPDYGWQFVVVLSVIAPLLYYFLAFGRGQRKRPDAPRVKFTRAQRAAQVATAILLAIALSLPVFVALYYLRAGSLPWQ